MHKNSSKVLPPLNSQVALLGPSTHTTWTEIQLLILLSSNSDEFITCKQLYVYILLSWLALTMIGLVHIAIYKKHDSCN